MPEEKPQLKLVTAVAISLVAFLTLIYIFVSDFTEYNMPYSIVYGFYFYTAVLLIISTLIVLMLRVYDRRFPAVDSKLWNYTRIAFGSLWVLDGILQGQPEMSFGYGPFILVPTLQALPALLQPLAQPIIMLWTANASLMNALSAVLQLFLGMAFLTLKSRRTVAPVAAISVVWSIAIWIFAESLGSPGIGMSILTGLPGAALLYAIASTILVVKFNQRNELRIYRYTFAALFIFSAFLQALPANGYWVPGSIAAVAGPYSFIYEPHLLSYAIFSTAVILSHYNSVWNILLVVSLLGLGLTWMVKPRIASFASIPLTAIIWFVGQDFGIFGGYGTDPNTGLVLVLMSLSVYLALRSRKQWASLNPVGSTCAADP